MPIQEQGNTAYTFRVASAVPEETIRLDELHAGLTAFFDGHLSLAPLESLKPTNILELGSGSGAWYAREATTIEIMFCVGSLDNPRAIQAARQFPDARITAVDIAPMPERDVPSNIHFRKMDITKRLPFNSEGYDVVHARFVMMHVRILAHYSCHTSQLSSSHSFMEAKRS